MKDIFYRTIATLSFFTRLPFWRLANVPKEYYQKVVPLWPVVGWVTSVCMGIAFYVFSSLTNISVGVIAAIIVRILITGALHEDGFADFCDGFGGGTSRERTLEIMKDSHIGTYGVLGLILYFTLLYSMMSGIATDIQEEYHSTFAFLAVMFVADVMSKAVSSSIIYSLPYARKESEAKNKLIYTSTPLSEKMLTVILSFVPCGALAYMIVPNSLIAFGCATVGIILMRTYLVYFMRKVIQGYTGDCCGAMFMICEATFYLVFMIARHIAF